MSSTRSLIVFLKNPLAGQVKTRLAESIGNDLALSAYLGLLRYTASVVQQVDAQLHLFYSDFIPSEETIFTGYMTQHVQRGQHLGERMYNATVDILKSADRVVLIGSDCGTLSPDIIRSAFETLETVEVVIGPAEDGGYYLIGMNRVSKEIFGGIEWSTEDVLPRTIGNILKARADLALLKTLRDVDTLEDWNALDW